MKIQWFVHRHLLDDSYHVSCQQPRVGYEQVAFSSTFDGVLALRAMLAGEGRNPPSRIAPGNVSNGRQYRHVLLSRIK